MSSGSKDLEKLEPPETDETEFSDYRVDEPLSNGKRIGSESRKHMNDSSQREEHNEAGAYSQELIEAGTESKNQESDMEANESDKTDDERSAESEHIMSGLFPEGDPVFRPMIPEGSHFGLFPETEEDRVREQLKELFDSLTEEQKEEIRELIRPDIESVEELDELVALFPDSQCHPDFKTMYEKAVEYVQTEKARRGESDHEKPTLIQYLMNYEAERRWADLVFWGITERYDYDSVSKQDTATDVSARGSHANKEALEETEARRFKRVMSPDALLRIYEVAHGFRPKVSIETMNDVDRLLETHESLRNKPRFKSNYEKCRVYVAVKNDRSKTQLELSRIYNIPQSTIGAWRKGVVEESLARALREREEMRIAEQWAVHQPLTELKRLYHLAAESDNETREDKSLGSFSLQLRRAKCIDLRHMDHVFSGTKAGEIDTERVVSLIESICRLSGNESRVLFCSLSDGAIEPEALTELQEFLRGHRNAIENEVAWRLGMNNNSNDVRLGIVEGRLYIWMPNNDANDLLNAWSSLFFCFRSQKEYYRLVGYVFESLELQDYGEGLKHFDKLIDELMLEGTRNVTSKSMSAKSVRILGEVLRFQMDATGLPTSYLEGRIGKIAGANGQGGIRNPHFLSGRQSGILRARLMATANSDFHIRTDGRAEYYEERMDRIDIFKRSLLMLGEMRLTATRRKGGYRVNIPLPVGRCLRFWGIPGGDKTLLNYGLPSLMIEADLEDVRAYAEDLIPQDGCFESSNGFIWTRYVGIEPGTKGVVYGLQEVLTSNELNLLVACGTDDDYDRKVMSWGNLKRLRFSNDKDVAESARSLFKKIRGTPSNLLEDEARMIRRLGINIETAPRTIRYHRKTGKVSVGWIGRTKTPEDVLKWASLCPPNDVRKRAKVLCFLKSYVKTCATAEDELIRSHTKHRSGGDADE